MSDTTKLLEPAGPELRVCDIISVVGSEVLPNGLFRLVYISPVDFKHIFKRLVQTTPMLAGIPIPQSRKPREHFILSVRPHDLRRLDQHSFPASWIEPVKRLATAKESRKKTARRVDGLKVRERIEEAPNKRLFALKAMCHPDVFHQLLSEDSKKQYDKLAAEFDLNFQTIKRLFYRLLDLGLNPERAAADGYSRSGRQANRRCETKQGRPAKMVKNELGAAWKGINTDEDHRRNIATFIQSAYEASSSIQTNFRRFKAMFAFKQIISFANGNVGKEMLPEDDFISYSQFNYHLHKILPAIRNRLIAKTIQAITAQTMRTFVGSARQHIPCPGHSLLIDSTIADVYLVCSFDRSKLIGRPVIYLVVDSLTSTIVGLHISLRTPSGAEAKIALFKAMSDKTGLLCRYGLSEYAHLFPVAPHPSEVLADRAELHSHNGRKTADQMSWNMATPAPYMAAWKGIVERLFKTTNNISIHWLPGSTLGRARERGERDVRLDAVLTLDEFTKIILHGVLLWNLRGNTTAFLPAEAFEDDSVPAPYAVYQWGLQNLHGSPRYFAEDEMVVSMLEPSDCRVSRSGIALDRNRWVGDWMIDPAITLSGLIHKEAQLYRDPRDPKAAFVRLNGEQILRPVSMTDMEIDGTEFDIEEYQAHEQATRQIHLKKTENVETTLMHESQNIVEAAKHLSKQAHAKNPQSKSAYLKAMDANRAAEIAHTQSGPAATTPGSSSEPNLAASLASSAFLASLANL